MASSRTNVNVADGCSFFERLPPELMIIVANEIVAEIRADPRLLLICKTWYAVALPIFVREVSVSDLVLWRSQKGAGEVGKVMKPASPFIETLRFKQEMRYPLPLTSYKIATRAKFCAFERNSLAKVRRRQRHELEYQKAGLGMAKLLRNFVDEVIQWPRLKNLSLEIGYHERVYDLGPADRQLALTAADERKLDPSWPYIGKDGTIQTEFWWVRSGLERLLQMENLTALRLCLETFRIAPEPGESQTHFCELINDKLPKLKYLWVSMSSICPRILSVNPHGADLPTKSITILMNEPQIAQRRTIRNAGRCHGSDSDPDFEGMVVAATNLQKKTPRARTLKVVLIQPRYIGQDHDWDDNDFHEYDVYSVFKLTVFDAVPAEQKSGIYFETDRHGLKLDDVLTSLEEAPFK